jgi:CheY-like chemotaxis protein
MKRECILLIEDRDGVREAVASSLGRAGSLVEAVRAPAEAIDCLATFRPNWILVAECQAPDLLAWLRSEECLRDVPVILLPDLKVPPHRDGIAATANDSESSP